ncbi:MAG TPA: hypothetical protein VJU77_03710 [Chthoniobacterales bacterium]|nr:hypothetical protein [Chthoniobacterales bacterium]
MTDSDYSEHCFSASDGDYDVPTSEANEERLLGIAQKVVRDTVPEKDLCVALSGGFDSRFLLFTSLLARKQAFAITLGHPGWLDVDLAKALTSALGIPHVITAPKPSSTVAQVRYILDEVEHLSDYLSPIWLSEFRTALIQTSLPVLNGFFGGPLTGGLSSPSCDPSTTSPSAVSRWLREVNKCSIRWSLLRRVCRVPVTPIRRMVGKHASALVHLAEGSIRALEFNYRQRGFVYLNTGNLYSLYCNVRTPFADLRLRALFDGLTSRDLRQQALYRRVLKILDTTGVPVASTTSRMYRPETFTSGPREFLFQSYRRLRPAIQDMIASTREQLDDFFDVDQLLVITNAARRDPLRGVPAFTEALLLVNAALWWLYARETP